MNIIMSFLIKLIPDGVCRPIFPSCWWNVFSTCKTYTVYHWFQMSEYFKGFILICGISCFSLDDSSYLLQVPPLLFFWESLWSPKYVQTWFLVLVFIKILIYIMLKTWFYLIFNMILIRKTSLPYIL